MIGGSKILKKAVQKHISSPVLRTAAKCLDVSSASWQYSIKTCACDILQLESKTEARSSLCFEMLSVVSWQVFMQASLQGH